MRKNCLCTLQSTSLYFCTIFCSAFISDASIGFSWSNFPLFLCNLNQQKILFELIFTLLPVNPGRSSPVILFIQQTRSVQDDLPLFLWAHGNNLRTPSGFCAHKLFFCYLCAKHKEEDYHQLFFYPDTPGLVQSQKFLHTFETIVTQRIPSFWNTADSLE